MPIYHFICTRCHDRSRKMLEPEALRKKRLCEKCGTGELDRCASPPSTSVKETLDNGFMIRKVERIAEAERIFNERSKNSEDIKEKY